MRVLGNILWLIFGGLIMALLYAIAGVVMFLLIITITFGIQAFKLSVLALWPFGRLIVPVDSLGPDAVVQYSVPGNPTQR